MHSLYILQEVVYFPDEKSMQLKGIYYDSNVDSYVRDRSDEELKGLMERDEIDLFTEDDWIEEHQQEELSWEYLVKEGLAMKGWEDKGVFLFQQDAYRYYEKNKHNFPRGIRLKQVEPIGTLKSMISEYLTSSRIIANSTGKKREEIYREEITADPIFLIRKTINILGHEHYKTIGVALTREEGEEYFLSQNNVFCHRAMGDLATILKQFFREIPPII